MGRPTLGVEILLLFCNQKEKARQGQRYLKNPSLDRVPLDQQQPSTLGPIGDVGL